MNFTQDARIGNCVQKDPTQVVPQRKRSARINADQDIFTTKTQRTRRKTKFAFTILVIFALKQIEMDGLNGFCSASQEVNLQAKP
jgi:hypothetical protein